MAISATGGISAADVNAIINSIQTTYKRYGYTGTATTVSEGAAASVSAINTAIAKLNKSISDSTDRRYYYYKGSTISTISAGALMSAATMSTISTANANVYKDYCNCDDDCSCDYDCDCDSDCCDSDCCDSVCNCDSDGCGIDCTMVVGDEVCADCSCNADCCNSDTCSDCACDRDCCDNDCCDSNY